MELSLLSQLNAERAARRAAILVTDMSTGAQQLVKHADRDQSGPLSGELDKRFLTGKSGMVSLETGDFFLSACIPSPRLVIIGAVHISQALVPMATLAGLDVSVIDPRTAFATEDRFPAGLLTAEWPEDVLKDAPLDPFTAVAALTHDPKIDDSPLIEALKAQCFYVGALGSRKTHGTRLDRLRKTGLSEDVLARIDAPIGLDIGAASPSEIAVAVLASIIRALRQPADRMT